MDEAIGRPTPEIVMATVVRPARSDDIPACGKAMYEAVKDIASVDEFADPGILIPTGNAELFRWCLDSGLRVVQQMILMDTAPPGPPRGAYWPAVLC